MRKKVRIVWWLTIIAACFVIGMQTYWLYSQFVYITDKYITDIINQVEDIVEADSKNRETDTMNHVTYTYNVKTGHDRSDSTGVRNKVAVAVGRRHIDDKATVKLELKNDYRDTAMINADEGVNWMKRDTFDVKASQSVFYEALHRYLTDVKNPLRKERIDSLINEAMPGLAFTVEYYISDSTMWDKEWRKTGMLVKPALELIYPYNPLENKCLLFSIQVPVNPLLKEMLLQLLLGLVFILILVGCLIFQMRIIFKQREMGALQYSFVNTMIHELKRPVQTLKMLISFLNDKQMRQDEAVSEQVVQDSFYELDSLSAYLAKLKDMARMDGEETLLHYKRFHIKDVVGKCLRTAQIPSDKKVNFTTYYAPADIELNADPVCFANVLNNLIENSVKYSGAEVDIRIEAKMEDKGFALTVSDNGIGIARGEQDHVFEKFYRGSNLPDSHIPGIGLGLSYVKLITDAHNGSITLNSRIGEGTSITIRLPQ